MTDRHHFNQQVWQAATLTIALAAAFVFGVIVLASGDWLPGGIIVGATTIGLAREIPVIRELCSTGSAPAPPGNKTIR